MHPPSFPGLLPTFQHHTFPAKKPILEEKLKPRMVLELRGLGARVLSKPKRDLWGPSGHPYPCLSPSLCPTPRRGRWGPKERLWDWGWEQEASGKGGAGLHQTGDRRGLGVRLCFLCWIISFQQFYCNYPENAAIYRVSQTAAVPGGRGNERMGGRCREEVGGGDRKGKGIRQEEG